MYKELFLILVGVVVGMLIMYYILKPKIGNKYEIDADIKNKKGVMNGNTFEGSIGSDTPPKQGILKRFKNKRLNKRRQKND